VARCPPVAALGGLADIGGVRLPRQWWLSAQHRPGVF